MADELAGKQDESRRPQVIGSAAEATRCVRAARARGCRVGVVPTMGALHEGHLSLVRAARSACDFVVATVFVNPTQFGPNEDYSRYPRTLDADLEMLSREGTDLVFTPVPDVMYPAGFSTYVDPPRVAMPLEGEFRPGHFRGVATVVLKLFLIVPADVAYFGAKDWQQTLVIRRMVEDLNVPIEVVVCPTVRESDGLAMSSRNRYLSPDDRQRALALSRGLAAADELFSSGERSTDVLEQAMRQRLTEVRVTDVDYATVVDCESLARRELTSERPIALIAARVGTTRLIDNRLLGTDQRT